MWGALAEFAADPAAVDEAGRAWLASAYAAARVDCPFLKDHRCSIYEERPLACRVQAVSSHPRECGRGPAGEVVLIRPPGEPPVRRLAQAEGEDWLPLVVGVTPCRDAGR